MQAGNLVLAAAIFTLTGCTATLNHVEPADLKQQVWATERAFARTMKDRDHPGFISFLADETVFFTQEGVLRGKGQVADWWQRFYREPVAPFAWEPQQVEVLDSGDLALSTGPVRSPEGHVIGTFTSIWRREKPGTWRIVFDKGCSVCPKKNAGEP